MKPRPAFTSLAMLAALSTLPGGVRAADADFDTTFDLDGRRLYSIVSGTTESNPHVFNGTDGVRWVIGRSREDASNARILTLRIRGSDGVLVRHGGIFEASLLQVKAAAPTPDGGAVALADLRGAAAGEVDVRLVKCDSIGALDAGFIGGGAIRIDGTEATPSGRDIEVDPKGGIHMLYATSDGGHAIHFAGPTGTSQTFVRLAPALGFTSARLGMSPDGKLVLARVTRDTTCRIGATRFLPDPGPYAQDGTFDEVTIAQAPCNVDVRDVQVDAAGRVVVMARTENGSHHFVRFLANGRLDPAFGGGDGRADLATGSADIRLFALALQSDGRIVAAGSAFVTAGDPLSEQVAVARLTAAGDPDMGFAGGSYGRFFRFVDASGTAAYTNYAGDVMIDPTNDRIVVGAVAVFGSADFALATLSGSPRLFGDSFE